MTRKRILAALLIAAAIVGCHDKAPGLIAASSISEGGFARDGEAMRELDGTQISVWGFVDHGNLYGDEGAREILGSWWSGDGPDADSWSFHLKARADDEVGRSFAVRVANDDGRDDLLRAFVADAEAGRPTRLVVTGTLHTFDAPTQATTQTGICLVLSSSRDVSLGPP